MEVGCRKKEGEERTDGARGYGEDEGEGEGGASSQMRNRRPDGK